MNIIDLDLKARWQAVHADYVLAHQDFMRVKLQREAAQGQAIDPHALLNARSHLEMAQTALSEFFERHAEFC